MNRLANSKNFKSLIEKQRAVYINTLRANFSGEFVSKEFNLYCKEDGNGEELTYP